MEYHLENTYREVQELILDSLDQPDATWRVGSYWLEGGL